MSAEAEMNSCNYSAAQAGGVLPRSRYQIPDVLQMYWQAVALSGLASGATDPEQRGCRSERRPALWRRGQGQRWMTKVHLHTPEKTYHHSSANYKASNRKEKDRHTAASGASVV